MGRAVLTKNEEAFVLHYVEHGNGHDAYSHAYNTNAPAKTRTEKASKMLAKDKIQARIAELRADAAKETVTTVADIVRQLDEDRQFAITQEAPAAAIQATMGKAKVLGLIVDKKEHTVRMPPDEARSIVSALLPLFAKKLGK